MTESLPAAAAEQAEVTEQAESTEQAPDTAEQADRTPPPTAPVPGLRRLANDDLTLTYLPERGGAITSLVRNSDGASVLWQAPWGVLPPGASRPPGTASVAARELWAGGWRTLFPSSGRAVTLYGADQGYDGEACLAPYRVDHESGTAVQLSTRLVRTPVRLVRTIELHGSTVEVRETVHNVGGQAIEMMWGQEIALGGPLLHPGTRVESGASVVRPEPDVTHSVSYDDVMPWPRTQGNGGVINLRRTLAEGAGMTWQTYLSEFSSHHATVTNQDAGLGVHLSWDGEAMPYLWYEMEAGGRHDYPHFSGSHYLALTPATAWPRQGLNDARRVSSTARWLSVDEEASSWVRLAVLDPREPAPAQAAEPESAPESARADSAQTEEPVAPDTSE